MLDELFNMITTPILRTTVAVLEPFEGGERKTLCTPITPERRREIQMDLIRIREKLKNEERHKIDDYNERVTHIESLPWYKKMFTFKPHKPFLLYHDNAELK